jgi:general secretion pathway protein B
MSYILDALRKAERERGIAQVPTLATVHDLRAMPRTRLWAVSGALILCVAAAIWLFFPFWRPMRSHVARQPEVGVDAAPSSVPLPESSATAGPGTSHDGRAGSGPAGIPPAEAVIQTPDASAQRPAATAHRMAHSLQAAPAPQQIGHRPEISQPDEKASPPPQPGTHPEGETQARGAAQANPVSLQEAVAKMTMSVLVFNEAKADRLVFINGRKYVEGDYVEGTYLLESISLEGAVLSYKGEKALLRPRSQ